MPKIKRVISFTQAELAWLEEQATILGISVGELLRRMVDSERLKSSATNVSEHAEKAEVQP